MLQLMVLYPQPADPQQFDADYDQHLQLLHEMTGIPAEARPYTVTKMLPTPTAPAAFYLLFTMPFESPEILQATMASAGMQEVSADAIRISTGGMPSILIGNTE